MNKKLKLFLKGWIGTTFFYVGLSLADPLVLSGPETVSLAIQTNQTVDFTVKNESLLSFYPLTLEANSLSAQFATYRIHPDSSCYLKHGLAPNETCNLKVEILAGNQIGEDKMSPRVCIFHGAQCFAPAKATSVIVTRSGKFAFQQGQLEITQLNLIEGAHGTLLIKNKGNGDILNLNIILPSKIGKFTHTCGINLAAHDSCSVDYTGIIHGSDILTVTGSQAENSPANLLITVAPIGHFVFQKEGVDITSLNVNIGSKGNISLKNTFNAIITDLNLYLPQQLGSFTSTCGTYLQPYGLCLITYTAIKAGSGLLKITGSNADNSPAILNVSVASAGHFSFEQEGRAIENLNLIADDTGIIMLKNTGLSSITNVSISLPSWIGIFNHNCSPLLNPSDACTIIYNSVIPGTSVLKVSGINADNSPSTLPVNIVSHGHLAYLQNENEITSLSLVPQAKGAITLKNSGGSAVTGLTINLPQGIGVFSTDCGTGLTAGSSCTISYSNVKAGAGTFSVSGENADNSGYSIPVTALKQAYITNFDNSTVSKCAVTSTGEFKDCRATGSKFSNPNGIFIENGFAYITNDGAPSVTQCKVNHNGELIDCAILTPLLGPGGIFISNGYVYITDSPAFSVIKCTVDSVTGKFSDCANPALGRNFLQPMGIFINKDHAYIVDDVNYNVEIRCILIKCTINSSTGDFSDCAPAGDNLSWSTGISISGDYAYVTSIHDKSVYRCTVNSSTGALSDCSPHGTFYSPNGIFIKDREAFLTNVGDSSVTQCDVLSSGELNFCVTRATGFSNPQGIFILS